MSAPVDAATGSGSQPAQSGSFACAQVVTAALVLNPYQPLALDGISGGCQTLALLHASPADPHPLPLPAPWLLTTMQDCGAVVMDCDITSTTGSGVGIEGGAPRLQRCSVHHCARHGEWGPGGGQQQHAADRLNLEPCQTPK